jgi:seryl-tRNA synthetase
MEQVNRKTTMMDYEVKLTREDLLENGKRISELDLQLDDLSSRQKAASADFKAQMSANESERKSLSKQIRDGKKTVTGECEINYDFTNRTVEFKAVETGKIVFSRKMTDAEYSLPSFGGDEE